MTWTTARLKHVARVGYGLGQPPPLSETGIPILRATNISRGKFSGDGLIFAAREDLPLDRTPLLAEGEILVVRSGAYTGDSAMVTSAWAGSAPGYDLRVSPVSAHPAYIAYCLRSTVTLDQMDLARNRAAQPHLNAEDLGGVTLRIPPIDEQCRIARYLDAETARIDGLLAATDRQIELLDCRRLCALRAMTIGIGEHIPTAATGIRWMPVMRGDWKLVKVGHSFKAGGGTTPRSSEPRFFGGPYPWINTADLGDGAVNDPAKSVSAAALQEYPALRVYPSGTLMVAMYGATTGRAGITVAPACVNQACCALIPLGPVDVTYALYWFIAHRPEIVQLASGGGQPNISQDLVRSLRIPAPDSVAEQRAIGRDCDVLEDENASYRSRLARRSALLAERRQALITAAVTGQIDVTTARAPRTCASR
jgi:type I restriction enzyme S subunit